jgi:Tellurite resistance protein TerB
MSIWGRLSGATSGLAEGARMGGPVRGLLGALAGHIVHHDSNNNAQHQISVIALGAKMAKADGVVTRDEIIAFKEVFKVPEGGYVARCALVEKISTGQQRSARLLNQSRNSHPMPRQPWRLRVEVQAKDGSSSINAATQADMRNIPRVEVSTSRHR